MLGRLSTHLASSWAARCANSFRSAPSMTVASYLECRGVLHCERARHHRAQRGCLNSWPPRISPPGGRRCPIAHSYTAETDVERVLCGVSSPVSVSAVLDGANGNNPTRPDVFRVRRAKMSGRVGLCEAAPSCTAETDIERVLHGYTTLVSVSAVLDGANGHRRLSGGEIRGGQEFACFRRAGGQGHPPPVL
jgi:hypothetical protein